MLRHRDGGRHGAPRPSIRGGSNPVGSGARAFLATAFFLFLFLTLTLASSLFALEARNIRFRHLSPQDGLSQETVLGIVQDHDGLMWFATQEGLNRYDGYEFKVFKPDLEDRGSLSYPFVRTIFEDHEGLLWVGTDGGGLDRFDRLTRSFIHFKNDPANPGSLSNDHIRVVYEDGQHSLWVGTEGGGLNRFDRDTGTFTRFSHNPSNPASLSNDHVRTLVQDEDGALWVGTDRGGLDRMDTLTGRFRHFVNDSKDHRSLASDQVRVVYQDHDGALWVGTDENGLDRFDRESETFEHFRHDPKKPGSIADDKIRAIHQDSGGTLWVATDGGLCELRAESRSFVCYSHDPTDPVSLSDNRVTSIYEDHGGVLWVGTYSGINAWNLGTGFFTHHKNDGSPSNQLSGNLVYCFAESPDGSIWIATYGGGLNRLDRRTGRYTHYQHDPKNPASLVDDRVMSLAVDREGILWVGTFETGLDRLDPKTGKFRHFRNDPKNPRSLSKNAVTRIFEDRSGVLWVGTYRGGLNRVDRKKGEFYRYQFDASNPTSLSNDRVMAIEEGENGILWIGTDGGGLNRFDPERGTFSRYSHDENDPQSLSSDHVWVVLRDRQSRLWVGTQGGGLSRWDRGPRHSHKPRFQRYSTREGLPSTVVDGILEDGDGNLWISTNRGISRFNPETEVFKNFDATDGLQPEFNLGAFYKATDGEMFFGGSNGFNSFHPERVRENPHVPPVTLTAFLKFNQPFDLGHPMSEVREISLTHKDYVVAFEFAGLDFTAPEKNRYRYKLDGFDQDWIDAGRLRRATYTNLSPRDYTFRVLASNNDGVWTPDAQGLAIRVHVIPPPWRAWWAYSLYGLTLAGMVYAYARKQARKLEREAEYNRKLQIEVDVRTQELAQRNKDLEAFNRKLEEASLTDSLTGFWNRRFLLQQIPKELAQVDRTYQEDDGESGEHRSPRSSLLFLMFDLDGFKGLNDTYGHAAGDRVLVEVRQMLLDACRQSDMIIRWGGDEFLLVGRNADPETAESLAERIRTVMEEKPFDVGLGQAVHLSCSIGFAFYPFDPNRPTLFTWEQVIGVADRALYVAKESGRNTWAGILSAARTRSLDLFKRINDDLETLVAEGIVDLRDSGHRRPRLVREAREARSGSKR
jgi:diguanylate cyclase (GGDEF)-like protein